MFYQWGINIAYTRLGLTKTAGIERVLRQVQESYRASPAARTEIHRMLAGGGLGALSGGTVGSMIGDEPSLGGIIGGAALGGVGGALGARSLGRMREEQIQRLLRSQGVPYEIRIRAKEQLIPRMPRQPKAQTTPTSTTSATESVNLPSNTPGMRGNLNIPPELAAQMRAAGML